MVPAITRHFVRTADGRRVHYRRCGSGPPVLIIHQSLHSSAENEALMRDWGRRFTCIAPDTPGFGQSQAIAVDEAAADAGIGAFADALVQFLDAIGVQTVGAYGYHSGGVILAAAVNRHPQRFVGAVLGAYALFTPQEKADFPDAYLPPFRAMPFGEHLAWLWNRLVEHTWFFPWFDPRNDNRQPHASANVARVALLANAILDSGEAYRAAYGAALHGPSNIPPPGAASAPTLIVASEADVLLHGHLQRLPPLPASWQSRSVMTAPDAVAAAFDFLVDHPAPAAVHLAEAADEGFSGGFHWRGDRAARRIVLHAPGGSLDLLDEPGALMIDLPGHGLSADFSGEGLDAWADAVAAAVRGISTASRRVIAGEGPSALLALAVAARLSAAGVEGLSAHIPQPEAAEEWVASYPPLTPDRFGAYLGAAWQMVRAERFFWPWFTVGAAAAIPFDPAEITPGRLALRHRSLLRARGGKALLAAVLGGDRAALLAASPPILAWDVDEWARGRDDVWTPPASR